MKAKLILNEIKRGQKNSGLGSLGIGRKELTRTHDHIQNSNYPSIISYCEDLDDIDLPEEIKDRVCEILDTTSDSIIGISDQQLSSEYIAGISADFINWLDQIQDNSRRDGVYETHNIDKNRYIIKTPYNIRWDIVRIRAFSLEIVHAPEEIYEQCFFFFRI